MLVMDGNNSLKRLATRESQNASDKRTFANDYFLSRDFVDQFADEVKTRQPQAKPQLVVDDSSDSEDDSPPVARAAPAPAEHMRAFTESVGSPESLAGVYGGNGEVHGSAAEGREQEKVQGQEKVHGPATFSDAMSAVSAASAAVQGNGAVSEENASADAKAARKLLPRETGEDVGMGSPVPLSSEAITVITNLRNMKVGIWSAVTVPVLTPLL